MSTPRRLLVVTSTLPSTKTDPVPAFVKDQTIAFKRALPSLEINILAPHNSYSQPPTFSSHEFYNEYRFRYFWPYRLQTLTGRGIKPALEENRLRYIQIPFLLLFEFIAVLRLTIKLKPDIIYAHWFMPQAITCALVARLTKTKFVYTTHASDVAVLKFFPFSKKIFSFVCNTAHAYTAVSQQTADKMLPFTTSKNRSFIMNKLKIIPMGTIEVRSTESMQRTVNKKYKLGNSRIIMFIGRLVYLKGVDLLIDSFKDLLSRNPDTKLVIAGDGQSLNDLKEHAESLGIADRIVFTGYASGSTKSALLHMAEIVCVPSRKIGDHSEGLPVAFMEAVTANKIVIASDVSGIQEQITDGENGYIFPERNVDLLTQKIETALNLGTDQLGQMHTKIALLARSFQWDSVARNHLRHFGVIKKIKRS